MENKQWFNKDLEQIYKELSSSSAGLSQKIARRRVVRGDGLLEHKKENLFTLISGVFSDFSPVILILVTLLAVIMEQGEGAGVITAVTFAYLAVSLFLNIRSQALIDGMCGHRTPRVQVQRDGKVFYVTSSSVVPGDVIMLSEGDVVPADCRIISAVDLFVHEGGVTNNAFSVPKFAFSDGQTAKNPEEMSNMLFALSKITHGSARAIVVDTGSNTYVVRTRGKNKIPVAGKLRVFSTLAGYSKKTGLIIPMIAFLLMLADIILPPHNSSVYTIFMWGFSLCAASASYLFQLLGRVSVASALETVARGGQRSAVITDMATLEKIRYTDTVLFSAESAVLTEDCRVCSLFHNNTEHDVYFPDGEGGREMLGMAAAIINSLGNKLAAADVGLRTPLFRAILNCAIDQGADSSIYPLVESVTKSSESRFNTALFYIDGEYNACSLGDAAEIMPYCSECLIHGKVTQMTTEIYSRALQIITGAESKAQNVIALAQRKTGYNNLHRIAALQSDLTLVGFMIIEREVSADFADTIEDIIDSDIQPIMFTSAASNPITSKNLAISLGVAQSPEQIITGEEVIGMSDSALSKRVTSLRAVVSVGGDERARIVYALQKAGKRVSYIGADNCDIAATTAANVSFGCAMTGRKKKMEVLSRDTDKYGSQILKMISDVTVQRAQRRSGGLAAYLKTLLAAESFFNNIRSAVAYLITVQMMRLVTAALGVCTGITVFSAAQILISGMIIDLMAIVAFSYKKEELIFPRDSKKWQYRYQLKQVLPYSLIFGALTVLIPFIAHRAGVFYAESISPAVMSSIALSQIALHAHYATVGCIVSPSEWKGGIPCGMMYVSVLMFLFAGIAVEPFGSLVGLYTSHAHDMLYSFITPILFIIVMEIRKYLIARKDLQILEKKE